MYVFDIEAEPTAASAQAADVAGASVIVFSVADSMSVAESVARSKIMDYGWLVKEVSVSLQPTDEQISRLDEDMLALHRQALAFGYAMVFVAHPKVQKSEDTLIEIRSLGSPSIDDSKNH